MCTKRHGCFKVSRLFTHLLAHDQLKFCPGVWKIIRGWLDPVVASKVHFTNNVKDLQEFISLDKIPDEMDGTSGWSYRFIEPVPGENERLKDTETRDRLLKEREAIYEAYESKTIEWLSETDAAKRANINSERTTIATNLKEQYWQLDPYIRSRSLYDRIGMIQPGGTLDYYPAWQSPVNANGPPPAAADDDVD